MPASYDFRGSVALVTGAGGEPNRLQRSHRPPPPPGTDSSGRYSGSPLGNRSLGVIRDAIADTHANGIAFDENKWEPEDDTYFETMAKIVEVHYPGLKQALLREALTQFYELREAPGFFNDTSTTENPL